MELVKEQAITLKKRLDELKKEERSIESQLYDLQKQVQPKALYGNTKIIVDPNYKDFMGKHEGEAVRLVDYLLNEQEKNDHMNIFGSISGDWKEQRGSVTYYRNEYGVLNHLGGGYLLLNDGIPCTDEEWNAIKEGNIPDKFRNTRIH